MKKSAQGVSGNLPHALMPQQKGVVGLTVITFVVAFVVIPSTYFAKPIPNGFYIVMNSVQRCPNSVKSLDGSRQYCLPREPAISVREIEYVGEVQTYPTLGIYYILIRLNKEGYTTLNFRLPRLSWW